MKFTPSHNKSQLRQETTKMAMDDSHQYQPPNVIVIVAHDLGDYLGCYGHTVKTPNLDRMATQGVRFANHFSTASLCSPSRGSIITGKYPHTNGLMGLCNLGWELPIDNITDAQRFADAGYHTHLVGSQHETKANNSLGFQNNYDMSVKGGHNYATDIVAEFAGDLLQTFADEKEGSNEPQPFYIRMGMFSVHRAISAITGNYGYDFSHANGIDESKVDVMPQWKDTPQLRQDLTGFTGDVNNMDRGVGILLDALDKSKFAQNTIVVFTTDHGIQYPFGKCSLYDLGIRTAMIVRYPQRFNAGTVIDAISSHIDILPTLMEVCGMEPSPTIQGRSLLPLIDGECETIHEEIFAEESTFPRNLIRCIRTTQFKFIRNFSIGKSTNTYSLIPPAFNTGDFYFCDRPEYELYDLLEDPHELHNLAGSAEHHEIESDLRTRLDQWMKDTKDPILNGSIQRPKDEHELFPKVLLDEHFKLLWEQPSLLDLEMVN